MTYDLESRADLGPRARFFGGSTPRPPAPPPPAPTGPTQAELEAAAKERLLARQRRGRKSTIITGQGGGRLGAPAEVVPSESKASTLGGG